MATYYPGGSSRDKNTHRSSSKSSYSIASSGIKRNPSITQKKSTSTKKSMKYPPSTTIMWNE